MKHITRIVFLLAFLPAVALGETVSDSTATGNGIRGELLITGGAGINILGTLLQLSYSRASYWKNNTYSISGASQPMYVIAADYGLGKRFSAGLEFGYQSAKVSVADRYYISAGTPVPFDDKWKRLFFGVRGDVHFLQMEKIEMYTGLKLGYSLFSMTSQRSDIQPYYTSQLNVKPLTVSVQGHVGCNYYFTPAVGLNAELGLGIGGPYLAEAGLVIKV